MEDKMEMEKREEREKLLKASQKLRRGKPNASSRNMPMSNQSERDTWPWGM